MTHNGLMRCKKSQENGNINIVLNNAVNLNSEQNPSMTTDRVF